MNTDDELLEQLRATLFELFKTDPATVTLKTKLVADIGLDSIDAIDLAARIETMSNQRVSEESLRSLRTIGDVVDLLRRLSAEASKAAVTPETTV